MLPSPEELPGGLAGRGVTLPRSVPLPSLGGLQSGCHWRRSGHGGRGPHTAPIHVRVPPPGVVRVSSLCAGAGSPACCGPRGSRRSGAWGRATCGLSCVLPRAPRPLRGEGGRPLTYDFSSCFFPKFKVMHFQNGDIKLHTVVLLFLCFLKI